MRSFVQAGCQALIFYVFLAITPSVAAEALRLPPMEGEMLDGTEQSLPAMFDGRAHMVLMLFDRDQQDQLDSWAAAKDSLPEEVGLVEIALIGEVNGLVRYFIRGGMKDSFSDKERLGRIMPYFGDAEAVKSGLNITDISQISAFLVDPDGQIIWQGGGAYKGQFEELPVLAN